MADQDGSRHRRNDSTPQAIPLQDLNRPPDNQDSDSPSHRRTLSERGRSLLRGRDSQNTRYAPLRESSPPRQDTRPTRPSLTIEGLRPREPSALSEPGQAHSFAGLSFEDNTRHSEPSLIATGDPRSPPVWLHPSESTPYMSRVSEEDQPGTYDNHLSPTLGKEPTTPVTPTGQARSSFQSVNFLTPERTSNRLGDDLNHAEAGQSLSPNLGRSGSGGRVRSLSPVESPLKRAGTMMRNISQRVVNLSNEADLIERSIKRKTSQKDKPLDEGGEVDEQDFGNDGPPPSPSSPMSPRFPPSPVEKSPSTRVTPAHFNWKVHSNPLRGKSMGVFPPDNPLRMKLCDILTHPATEPFLLVLIITQTVLLTIDAARDVYQFPRPTRWGDSWIDYGLLTLFVIYTAEVICRIIVSGFMINPVEYSTINRQIGIRQAVIDKGKSLFSGPDRQPSVRGQRPSYLAHQPPLLRSFTAATLDPDDPANVRQQQRVRLAHRAFLRHSFNRLDFVAVVSFWISFVISVSGLESTSHVYVFRMLSCLRILRLLGLTSGTTVILRSLKRAAPLLVNVGFLIGFFWLLFAIIGVQSFKSSLKRTCVWVDPTGKQENYTNSDQHCGGYVNATGAELPWVNAFGLPGASSHKGYLCPYPSVCVEGDNPFNDTQSYDNIFNSLELVFVLMTSNTFSDLLYDLTDSDYLAAALFFACGIVILALWMMNLLIAVITSSFQVIRDESKTSAFTAQQLDETQSDEEDQARPIQRMSTIQRAYHKSSPFWILVIVYGLICQAMRSADMSDDRSSLIDASETVVTILLLIEIIFRIISDWRHFYCSKRNMFDLLLAIVTTVIQIPAVRQNHEAYAWMTVFQILRIYRVVLAVKLTRDLIQTVLGNASGLLNLIFFVFLITYLASLFATQIFRGELPQENDGETIEVTFKTLFNAFLGMYQLLSSENWTTILYNVTNFEVGHDTAWIGAAFLIMWYILANFIVLNMFIAVIQEGFDVSEDEKRLQQVKAFLQQKEQGDGTSGNLSLSTIFKLGQASAHRRDPLDYGTAATEMLLKDAVVRDFLDEPEQPLLAHDGNQAEHAPQEPGVQSGIMSRVWSWFVKKVWHREPNPFYARLEFSKAYADLDPREMAKELFSATERRKKAQREYLQKHPSYNVSLFLFKPHNPIRTLCQRIVGPGRGEERIEGVAPSIPVWYAFSAFVYAAIVAMVLLACITTPVYQKEYFDANGYSDLNWFVYTDLGFSILFTVEALIKVIADGFFWTPNAYFRSSWGFIDGIVLVTLWINVGTLLMHESSISRAVGAFKALRALRLLNVSDSARNTFHHVIIRGGWKVLSALFVSLSFLIPFAIYGLNLFNGQMYSCNDSDSGIVNLEDCVGEFNNTVANWPVLSPRQASNSWYDFDNFGDSLFILFTIVSQEGWIDVMWSAQSITGKFKQPKDFASQGNAVFFVVFNLLGAVFVLTLFVSVFMRNYTEQTGVAYLTTDQRSWLELRKLLRQVAPSKRPSSTKKRETWEEWCYRRAVRKTGRWQRFITFLLLMHLLLLCLEYYPEPWAWERTRDYIFLLLTALYMANIAVRIIGLTWARFRRSAWDMYALVSVTGAFTTTILLLTNFENRTYVQLHKLCLVSIALLLIPRNNQLDTLFKTAAASITSIANLLATWFVLFLVFAIAMTQAFGLTRFGEQESGNVNFRTVPKALILLFRMSSGEGWNQVMEDFASIEPPLCTIGTHYWDGDCGSAEWARTLFILWNILSMYIFVNLFVSLIYESFSYVYQRSSGLSVISRQEIRRFKQAWAEFDPNGTGFVPKEKFPRLLGELSGVFEMRIYDGDFTVGRIIEDCSKPQRHSSLPVGMKETPEIDLDKLNDRLADLPIEEIRKRRNRVNRFYEEILNGADPDRGVQFTSLLITLAHYKVINENKSLRLEEFLRRKARLQRVEESVQRKTVIGFFDTLYWSRRFRRALEAKKAGRMVSVPQFEFTMVEDTAYHGATGSAARTPSPTPSLDPLSFDGPTFGNNHFDGRSTSPPALYDGGSIRSSRANSIQKTPVQSRGNSVQASPVNSPRHSPVDNAEWQLAAALNLSRPGTPSNTTAGAAAADDNGEGTSAGAATGGLGRSASGASDGGRSRPDSDVSAQDVLDVFANSAWGQSIRKSFSLKRPGSGWQ
ncbi:calcium-channel protein CCH1 [Phyllosticta citriasiana]|uniref:Calcium-channel protein CCH1 n=1 Tax=Phyllosticta citriasiana TaxID=595635 RepID=A0ABR1KBS7_9PEZI